MALCAEHGFGQYASHGRLLARLGPGGTGAGERGPGPDAPESDGLRGYGAAIWRPYFLAVLAEGYGQVGAADEGLRVLTEALAAVQATGERVWEAELQRLKGELVLQTGRQSPGLEVVWRTLQKRRRVFTRPWRWPAVSRPERWSCGPP